MQTLRNSLLLNDPTLVEKNVSYNLYFKSYSKRVSYVDRPVYRGFIYLSFLRLMYFINSASRQRSVEYKITEQDCTWLRVINSEYGLTKDYAKYIRVCTSRVYYSDIYRQKLALWIAMAAEFDYRSTILT